MNNKKFGSEQRALNTKQKNRALVNVVSANIDDFFCSNDNFRECTNENFGPLIEIFLSALLESKDGNEKRIILGITAKKIIKNNRNYNLDFPVPKFSSIINDTSFKNKTWFKKSNNLHEIYCEYYEQLNAEYLDGLTKEQLVVHILISAAIHGGLCVPSALTSLANALTFNKVGIKTDGYFFWIDLIFKDPTQNGNVIVDDKEFTLRRWYIDPTTKIWLYQLIQSNEKLGFVDYNKVTENRCWSQISQVLISYTQKKLDVDSLSSFCRTAIFITERLSRVDLNQPLVNYAAGYLTSSSLPAYFLDNQAEINSTGSIRSPRANKNCSSYIVLNHIHEIEILSTCIKSNLKNGTKVTPKNLIQRLSKLGFQYKFSAAALFLIDWLESLLSIGRKASTINTYFHSIGKVWISHLYDENLTELESGAIENIYIVMIDNIASMKSQQYATKLLIRLHEFGVSEFDFPYLDEKSKFRDLSVGNQEKSFVKASFISESLFAKLTSKIFALPNSTESKHDLFVFCLLTYRLGCRGSELIKLRLKDIESSDQLWMCIKNNSFGDNKSSSGLRKLPIALFLTKLENEFFKCFYSEKKQMCRNPKKALLFSSAINENIPLKYNELSQEIKSIFQKITSLPVNFNSLRHSAISRFQLIFDADLSIINRFTAYSDSQIEAIQKAFGSLNKDKFFNISALAGHITPEVTFMHYMHFTDLLLGSKLEKMDLYLSKIGLQNISNLSCNKITRLTKDFPVNEQQYSVHSIEPFVSDKLAEYCRKNKNVYTPINEYEQTFKLIFNKSMTAEKCYKVLKKVEDGVSVDDVSLAFSIEASLIEKWLKRAYVLAKFIYSGTKTSAGCFPFCAKGFYSDNGSEYINKHVCKLLDKFKIELTKTESSNDR